MSLKDIEKQLYGMGEETIEEEDIFEEPVIEQEKTRWKKPEAKPPLPPVPKRPPLNFYKPRKKPKFLYFFLGALALVLIVEGVVLAQKYFSRDASIDLSFSAPEEVLVAAPFDFKVTYKNGSSNLLRDTTLIVELPKNIKSLSDASQDSFIKRDLGDLGTESSNTQTFNLVALGDANRVVSFKVTLQYNLPGFSSRFEKSDSQNLSINGAALTYNTVLPQNVISGEEFVYEIDYTNNTNQTLTGLKVQTFYPLGFNFTGASIDPAEGNNVWAIGDLAPKDGGKILIKGNLLGQSGSFYEFGSQLSIAVQNQIVNLDKKTAGVTIQASPLKLAIFVNGASDYTANLDEMLEYRIDYQNNTPIGLEEVIIKAKLNSDLFDLSSTNTSGYFDSSYKQIIWNAGNTPALRLINRGESGSVSFKIKMKNSHPIKVLSDKNFVVTVQAQMESPSVPPATNLQKTTAVTEISSKVAGKANLLSFGFFRDAASGIINKGTLPLHVGIGTNFTIHWKIINYSNDLSDVVVKAVLPQGISWTNMVAGNYGDSAPTYNERTSEVTWIIPKLPATTGVVLPAREAIFQIAAIPSLNQVGNYMTILNEAEFSAKDEFTGQDIQFTVSPITSELSNDSTVKSGDGKVQQ
ncbi:MAG TPA: hypothetical protein P5524_02640 [Candidatus Paceibacterota bacterium]|nr:hypothetical protein [Candidatus Paceibacterota bacterium]